MRVNVLDLVMGFSSALDHISVELSQHHARTALIMISLLEQLDMNDVAKRHGLIAALLHDAGVIPLKVRVDDLRFEKLALHHAEAGWAYVRTCPRLKFEAEIILRHHTPWKILNHSPIAHDVLANLLHLADTLDIETRHKNSPSDIARLVHTVRLRTDDFMLQGLNAAEEILSQQNLWEKLKNPLEYLRKYTTLFADSGILKSDELVAFATLFAHIIDASSPFTATHSFGVAHTALILAQKVPALHDTNLNELFIAGLLHDIGKLGVPKQLLEKASSLSRDEYKIIRLHAKLSLQMLNAIPGFENVSKWGALHHERLDGKGYPLGLKGDMLCPESRLVAIADMFTAIMEDRPYRLGMKCLDAKKILEAQKQCGALDPEIINILFINYEEINKTRARAQADAEVLFEKKSDIPTRTE